MLRLLYCLPALCGVVQARGPVARTTYGTVEGGSGGGADAWWGVPYAAPPVGALRYAPPQPPQPWGARAAVRQAPGCLVVLPHVPGYHGEEDCLYLNVYTPAGASADPASALPVLYWIHGGGFIEGSKEHLAGLGPKSWGMYDGRRLAVAQNAVVVAVEYRQANFGFLALPELRAEHGTTGNYGLLDQQQGLRWVQENIAGFGGDPARVAIFGESAGGSSVAAQTLLRGGAGLFRAAIAESGYPGGWSFTPLRRAEAWGAHYAGAVGCNQSAGRLRCLRALPWQRACAPTLEYISQLWPGLPNLTIPGRTDLPLLWPVNTWGPTIDGTVLAYAPYDPRAVFHAVPIIAGTNHDEGTLFGPPAMLVMPTRGPCLLRAPLCRIFAPEHIYGNGTAARPRAEDVHWVARHLLNETVLALFEEEYRAREHPEIALERLIRDYNFVCPTRAWLRGMNRQKLRDGARRLDTWMYMFNFSLDGSLAHAAMGDHHGSELKFVFGDKRLLFAPGWTDADARLSNHMQSYWRQLAAAGDPNGSPRCDGCIDWPAYEDGGGAAGAAAAAAHLLFDVPLRVGRGTRDWGATAAPDVPSDPRCDFWDRIGYDQPYGSDPAQ